MIIVFNPAAGRGRAARLHRALDALRAAGLRPELAPTRHPGHATEIARAAGPRLVVAAGGDGTVAEVVNGLADGAVLGVIPLGTANVFAHELGLARPSAAVAALVAGRTRTLWPGRLESPAGSRLFVQMVGAGLDARVVHGVSLPLKRRIGRGAYVASTLRELARTPPPLLRLRVDGQEAEAATVVVSKGQLYGGRYLFAPKARPSQPGFQVSLFPPGRLPCLLAAATLPLNLLPRLPGRTVLSASQVDIHNPAPLQADGDPAETGPALVTDAPMPIRIVHPTPA